jgi:hypothetical protein
MSDSFSEQAAEQIRQQGDTVLGQGASEQEIATAAQAHAGIGVTEADIDAIRQQLASFQKQLDAQAAAQAKVSSDAITGSVATLVHHLEGHGDQAAIELGKDATEAAKAAVSGGNTGALSGIIGRIAAHLRRNPPYPGENFHYNSALSTAEHLPVVIDRVNASAEPRDDQAPAKVVAGSVVG